MGTFHDDKGELHGITVIVDTHGSKVFVGRCDTVQPGGVILLDADEHEDGHKGRTKAQYLERAKKFGVWKKHDRLAIPMAEVATIQKLSDFGGANAGPAPSAPQAAKQQAAGSTAPQAGSVSSETATATAEPPAPAQPAEAPKKESGDVVDLTEKAKTEVKRLILSDENKGKGLRLGVSGGGCSGLVYKLEFDTHKDGDVVIHHDGFDVYLDRKSTIYLRGVTLDFQGGLQGKGFVFQNPNATNTCGCGESFSV